MLGRKGERRERNDVLKEDVGSEHTSSEGNGVALMGMNGALGSTL